MGGQRTDQTGVGTFRRFDRADPAVVRRVDVAHGEASALTGETTWAQGADAALVGELSQGVGLIHELAQLAGAEELLDRRHQGLGVHQLGRGEALGLTHGHAFLDDPLEAVQAHAHLVLQQFAHGANAAVAEVVDVIEGGAAHIELEVDQVIDRAQHVLRREGAGGVGDRETQLLVDLVATNAAQVVALGIEEAAVQQGLTTAHRGRFTRTQLLVELEQGLVFGSDAFIVGRFNRLLVVLGVPQLVEHVVVRQADGPHQHVGVDLAGLVDANVQQIVLVGLEFQPGAAVGDQAGVEGLTAVLVLLVFEVDTG